MFDRLELSPSLSKYLISVSPVLGISGDLSKLNYYMITKYFSLEENKVLVELEAETAPEELSLNLLRKGEDPVLMAAKTNDKIDEKYFKNGSVLSVPIYQNSVISFECKKIEQLEANSSKRLVIYEVVQASGVAGLDPDFNDAVTIAKTLEIMTLTAVDAYIINRKIGS